MTEKKFVALTFDDGPTPGITDQVLDVLKENDIVASFFLIGQKITEQSEYLIRRAYGVFNRKSLQNASGDAGT